MPQDTCSPGILGREGPGIRFGDQPGTPPGLPALRCADAARMCGEPLQASAVRYRRFLLLEVPGPWGSSALAESHLEAGVARRLGAAAAEAGLQVVLIRRPGRQPSAGSGARTQTLAWAIADTSPEAEGVRWGSWRDPADLLGLDLAAGPAQAGARGPQRLALVCTNGKRDQCCAIRGRPVAAAMAAVAGWDTWECSHLGGHRFAATILLLPSGDMFGWLDPDSAVEVLQRFDAGQIVLSRYRGRCGQPVPVQAALHAAAVRLRDFRRGAVRVSSVRSGEAATGTGWPALSAVAEDIWEVEVTHRADDGQEPVYRVTMTGSRLAPTLLSCADSTPKSEVRYQTTGFARVR
jgi:hypothetical protein